MVTAFGRARKRDDWESGQHFDEGDLDVSRAPRSEISSLVDEGEEKRGRPQGKRLGVNGNRGGEGGRWGGARNSLLLQEKG